MYDNTMMGLEVAIMILRAIKGVCSNRSSCVGCCFLNDHDCLLECEPEDYQIDKIKGAMIMQLRREAAEKMSQSLEEALKEGDQSGT